jgi:hypothetical protein
MTETENGVPSTRWRWIVALWLAYGVFDASQTVLVMRTVGRDAWLVIFATAFVSWLPWVLATPYIISLARRHTFKRGRIVATLGIHAAALIVVSLITSVWFATLQVLFNPWRLPQPPTIIEAWRTSFPYQVLPFLIVYGLIWTGTLIVDARARMNRQATETARLNEELSRAQLAALRGQVEPHFMFNTLNSIAGLVREQRNDAAVSMVVGLSEFLRRATQDFHRSQVTLAEEVEYLQRYLDIQKVRFGERLRVSVDITPEALRAQVPSLLLQPLVENAIKHGIAKRVAGGAVRVTGTCTNGTLRLSVYNDGPSESVDPQSSLTGVGLSNLRTRLRILHGEASDLELKRAASGEAEVIVTLPLEEA